MTTPNTLSGGIALWIAQNSDLVSQLSLDAPPQSPPRLRIRAGRAARTWFLPWVILSYPGAQSSLDSDRVYLEDTIISVSIYAEGESEAQLLGEKINDWLLSSHSQIYAGAYGYTFVPTGPVMLLMDPEKSPTGGDIYRTEARYKTKVGRVLPA